MKKEPTIQIKIDSHRSKQHFAAHKSRKTFPAKKKKTKARRSSSRKEEEEDDDDEKKIFRELEAKLGIKKKEDWYLISPPGIRKVDLPAFKLLRRNFGNSIIDFVSHFRPSDEWIPWDFLSVTRGFWNDVRNRRMVFERAGRNLGLVSRSDWLNPANDKVIESEVPRSLQIRFGSSWKIALMVRERRFHIFRLIFSLVDYNIERHFLFFIAFGRGMEV